MMRTFFFSDRSPFLAFAALTLAAVLTAGLLSCENPEGALHGNSAPDTRLANVPADDTVAQYLSQGIVPQQTLYWHGDDPDGFVIAFRYTWTDIYQGTETPSDTVLLMNLTAAGDIPLDTLIIASNLTAATPGALFRIYNFIATLDPDDLTTKEAIRDSLATFRPFFVPYPSGFIATDIIRGADPLFNEAPTKGVFIFDSPADSNMHRFEVWAIDNNELIDPTPARIHFWTLPSPGLTVWTTSGPTTNNIGWVLSYPTERSPGLTFGFSGSDPSTNERDYSWAVDDTANWSIWDPSPFATVTAIDFEETGSDTHTFFLQARNKWGVLSPIHSRLFTAKIPPIDDPTWPKKVLILNNSRISDPLPPPPPNPEEWLPPVDTADVNAFYIDVMTGIGKQLGVDYDIYVTAANSNRFPDREVLALYTSVLLLAEQDLPNSAIGTVTRIDANKQGLLTEYLNIGGKMIFSGPPNVRLMFGTLSSSTWEVIADEIFHIVTSVSTPPIAFLQNDAFDFVGARGILGYSDISVDTTKLPSLAGGAMANIAVNYPRGFGQTISEFDSRSNNLLFEGNPLGIRYVAPPPIPPASETFSVVYFGFPLYYMNKDQVIAVLGKAFDDIKE